MGAVKKYLPVEDQVHASGTCLMKHSHERNKRNQYHQRNQRNQSNQRNQYHHCVLGNTAQRDLRLVLLKASIDYADDS